MWNSTIKELFTFQKSLNTIGICNYGGLVWRVIDGIPVVYYLQYIKFLISALGFGIYQPPLGILYKNTVSAKCQFLICTDNAFLYLHIFHCFSFSPDI